MNLIQFIALRDKITKKYPHIIFKSNVYYNTNDDIKFTMYQELKNNIMDDETANYIKSLGLQISDTSCFTENTDEYDTNIAAMKFQSISYLKIKL